MAEQTSIYEDVDPDLEPDDSEDSSPRTKPWNAADVRVATKPWSLRQIVDDIEDGTIDLAPDFQRHSVWGPKQRTLLIESILLGIPLPAFYFDADHDQKQRVVDGVQRLTAIRDFAGSGDSFPLTDDLEYLKDIVGQRFAELGHPLKRRFHQTQIVVHVIDPASPPDLKYDIFKRINTGGSPLTPQEIRHCMSKKRSRDFLGELVSSETFKKHVGVKGTRMQDRAMVLRFVAFYRFAKRNPSFDTYPPKTEQRLDGFLLQATSDLDNPELVSDAELADLKQAFERTLQNNAKVFGDEAYRKSAQPPAQRTRLSQVIFEVWTVALARVGHLTDEQALRIQKAAKEAMSDDAEFVKSFSQSTGDSESIRTRFCKAFAVVKGTMEAGE